MRIRGMVVVSAAMWLAVAAPMSVAQTSAPVANAPAAATANMAATVAPAKAYAFDVVSIRQNISPMQMMMGPQSGPPQFGPTGDGYRMSNMSLLLPMMTAYVPQVGGAAFYAQDQVKGYPAWMMTERYDIDARIADADQAEWQKPES